MNAGRFAGFDSITSIVHLRIPHLFRGAAFTLVELLVVVAILAVLIGISLPVYNSIAERGRAAADLSNLRNIAVGIQNYALDNDQILVGPGMGGWPEQIEAVYVRGWENFKSPLDPRQSGSGAQPVSYAMNIRLLGKDQTSLNPENELILLAPNINYSDEEPEVIYSGTSTSDPTLTRPGGNTPRGQYSRRQRTNVSGLDGAAKALSWAEFTELWRWDDTVVQPGLEPEE